MAKEVEKSNILLMNCISIKQEECEFVDENVNVNVVLRDHKKYDELREQGVCSILDDIKTELSLSEEQCDTRVKIKDEIYADYAQIQLNGFLYCEHCHMYYEDYCNKCGMLVHILNRNTLSSRDNSAQKELPNDILEIQERSGQFRVFALKAIPTGVIFGPFTGLTRTKCSWKIKGGKFVENEDKSEYLNWMQYVNPARNISEKNLHVFQYDGNLYYQSIYDIQEGDELKVHFGDEYEDSLNKNVGVDFIPTTQHIVKDVFACTFCSLGFSSKWYLAKHKAICHMDAAADGFSIQDLIQCPFCKIHLDRKEYFKQHMAYCCERNARKITLPTRENQTSEVKKQKTRLYKCELCKYLTKYKGDFKNHANQHHEVKLFKCGVCYKRFKKRQSLKRHVENAHKYVDKKEDPDFSNRRINEQTIPTDEMKKLNSSSTAFQTNYQHLSKRGIKTEDLKELKRECEFCDFQADRKLDITKHTREMHHSVPNYKCDMCSYETKRKFHLKSHINARHLRERMYECGSCQYKAAQKSNLTYHIKTKHLKQVNYNCGKCNYETTRQSNLEYHTKAKHLKTFLHKCGTCEYKTNRKCNLEYHTKTIHLEEFNYKCDRCCYKTNLKINLDYHTKTKHLKEFKYKCDRCDYTTNWKANLITHVKSKHLKEFNYLCVTCDYKSNQRSNLEYHVKTKHLKQFDYKCDKCEFKTNLKSNLVYHTKTKHLKEFNYKCDTCAYKTNQKCNLDYHIKTKHLKEFNYKCDVCVYQTNLTANLKYHIKNKH